LRANIHDGFPKQYLKLASRIQAFAASYQDALADPTSKDPVVRNAAQSSAR
jgi:hypothetical protein